MYVNLFGVDMTTTMSNTIQMFLYVGMIYLIYTRGSNCKSYDEILFKGSCRKYSKLLKISKLYLLSVMMEPIYL